MKTWIVICASVIATALVIPGQQISAEAATLGAPLVLSDGSGAQAPDFDGAAKPKIFFLNSSGMVVAVFGDTPDPGKVVFDLKQRGTRPAQDIFVRTCNSLIAPDHCDSPGNWTPAVNISRTADKTSISTDWDGYVYGTAANRVPYYGDSETSHAFAAGNRVVVSWVDKYCPGDDQRMTTYVGLEEISTGEVQELLNASCEDNTQATLDGFFITALSVEFQIVEREIPFSCVYAAWSSNGGKTWSEPRQMTTGLRDAKQDSNKGLGSGAWGIIWQEDPLGLQPGEADGPGEGASGARVSHGTDVWYSYAEDGWPEGDAGYGIWHAPVRLTDNTLPDIGVTENDAAPIKDNTGTPVPPTEIDKGQVGASRPNISLVYKPGVDSSPVAVVAYEETKGSEQVLYGKYVRLHTFPHNDPVGANNPVGCIISEPMENSRRVRIVTQHDPGLTGLRMAIFWKQGLYAQGGPSDIVLRLGRVDTGTPGSSGLHWTDLSPGVDPACEVAVFGEAIQLVHDPGLNISHGSAAMPDIGAGTDVNNLEDARAHRALLRGDDLHVGYSYTPHQGLALNTNLENYDFWMRHYDGSTWDAPVNVTQLPKNLNVNEPRLVGTRGSNTKPDFCPDPANPADNPLPEFCQDTDVFYVAWGTETNGFINDPVQTLDIFVTYTTDGGRTLAPPLRLPKPVAGSGDAAAQLNSSPDGSRLFVIWEGSWDEGSDANFVTLRSVPTFLVEGIEAILTHYYESILGRPPDPGGLLWWRENISRLSLMGIDIKEGFIAAARYFFSFGEYTRLATGDTQYITDLYTTFLNRNPDPSEVAYWEAYLQQGFTRGMLFNGFVYSAEFRAYMEAILGRDMSRPEPNLVNDFFRSFLNRLPENEGFAFWLSRIRLAQCGGEEQVRATALEMATLFAGSPEYAARARTNAEYLEDLYNGFLRRGAEPAGFLYWLGMLDQGGMTRADALEFFAQSREFEARVQEVLRAGCVDPG